MNNSNELTQVDILDLFKKEVPQKKDYIYNGLLTQAKFIKTEKNQ